MKPSMLLSIICVFMAFILLGCGKSDEQLKKLGALQSEVFRLQQQYSPLISELGKVAMQIETLAKRKDLTATGMTNEIDSVHEQIATAFRLTDEWQSPPPDDFDRKIKTLEFDRDLLKKFIDQSSAAIKKSREVIEAMNTIETQKKNARKK